MYSCLSMNLIAMVITNVIYAHDGPTRYTAKQSCMYSAVSAGPAAHLLICSM